MPPSRQTYRRQITSVRDWSMRDWVNTLVRIHARDRKDLTRMLGRHSCKVLPMCTRWWRRIDRPWGLGKEPAESRAVGSGTRNGFRMRGEGLDVGVIDLSIDRSAHNPK